MKTIKRVLVALLALMMLFGAASCGEDTAVVMSAGEHEVTAGVYLYHLLSAYSTASGMVTDREADVLSQKIENQEASAWIAASAQKSARNYLVVEQMFAERNLTLPASETDYIDQYAAYQWSYLGEMLAANGIAPQSLIKVMTNNSKSGMIFTEIYGEDGEKAIPADEVKTYIGENYAKIKVINLSLKDASGTARTGAVLEEVQAKAADYQKRLEAGEDIDKLIEEAAAYEKDLQAREAAGTAGQPIVSEPTSSVEATENTSSEATSSVDATSSETTSSEVTASTEETASATTSSESTTEDSATTADPNAVIVEKSSTYYSDEEKKVIFDLAIGAIANLSDTDYIRVFKRFDIFENDTYLTQYDSAARAALKGEEFTKMLEDYAAAMNIEVNNKATKRYNPSKIQF